MTDEQIKALIARWREREHLAALHSVRNEYEAGQCRAYFTCAAELEALLITGMSLREIVDQAFAGGSSAAGVSRPSGDDAERAPRPPAKVSA